MGWNRTHIATLLALTTAGLISDCYNQGGQAQTLTVIISECYNCCVWTDGDIRISGGQYHREALIIFENCITPNCDCCTISLEAISRVEGQLIHQ